MGCKVRSRTGTESCWRKVMPLFGRALRFAVAWAGLSYVLAFPLIGVVIVMELHLPDEICIDTDPSGLGIWLQEEGKQVCKFLARRVLLFWSLAAMLASPVAIALMCLRGQTYRSPGP